MAQTIVNLGGQPNDGTGDSIRDAFDKVNNNFTEVYFDIATVQDFVNSATYVSSQVGTIQTFSSTIANFSATQVLFQGDLDTFSNTLAASQSTISALGTSSTSAFNKIGTVSSQLTTTYNSLTNLVSASTASTVVQMSNLVSASTASTVVQMSSLISASTASTVPIGIISLWYGSVATIPGGWKLCDGTNSTPDLRDRFVMGAGSTYIVNATGLFTTGTSTTIYNYTALCYIMKTS